MVKIQHKQSEEIRDISRDTWENTPEYKAMRQFWQVLDEGDPVRVFWIEDNGEHTDLGLKDRDHAKNMIKINSRQCYFREVDEVPMTKPGEADESGLLDQILNVVLNGGLIHLSMDTTDNYRNAVKKLVAYGLIQPKGKTYEPMQRGFEARKSGGVENWINKQADIAKPVQPSISVHGHAIIGNNNSGNNQGRDLKSESPILMTSQQPSATPEKSPIKKSDHSIWDKIKYISGIAAAVAALISLFVAIAKALGYL